MHVNVINSFTVYLKIGACPLIKFLILRQPLSICSSLKNQEYIHLIFSSLACAISHQCFSISIPIQEILCPSRFNFSQQTPNVPDP
jgi:uncharacterized membrane protein